MCLCVVPLRRTPVQAYWSFSINAQHSATTNSPSFSVVSLISLYQPRNKTVTQIYRINLSNGFKSCESLYNSKLICNERMKEKLRFSVVGVHTHTHTHTHTQTHISVLYVCEWCNRIYIWGFLFCCKTVWVWSRGFTSFCCRDYELLELHRHSLVSLNIVVLN
jgi:hypothetical protein